MLGRTDEERMAALERQVRRSAARSRLAGDLHDGLGHALSVVSMQLAAARRLLATDPARASTALIPTADLRSLSDLLDQRRATGMSIRAVVGLDPARLPAAVSREGYRIAQEALTNAARHGEPGVVDVDIDRDGDAVRLRVSNPVASGRHPGPLSAGRRGFAGMAARAELLGGRVDGGATDGRWVVTAELPAGGHRLGASRSR